MRKPFFIFVMASFLANTFYIPSSRAEIVLPALPVRQAGGRQVLPLMPKPGTMVKASPSFTPAYLKGIVIHPNKPFQFDFLVDKGEGKLTSQEKNQEYTKLVKYFLAALTVLDKDQWVNLSPYEKDRIVSDSFGKTEMGRDLLSQDYLLKQITSSLMYPESKLGKSFWDKVYTKAREQMGNTNIPVNTFNKVWIVPDKAVVYENGNTVYVQSSHLKVMLEEDYLATSKNPTQTRGHISSEMCPQAGCQGNNGLTVKATQGNDGTRDISSQVIKDIILPVLEREVNEGKNFAQLRQVFSGMILATWYKRALKESILAKVYANKAKVKGVDQDPVNNERIYQQYLQAYKKGVYNYVKDEADSATHQIIPRKYFSGGAYNGFAQVTEIKKVSDQAMIFTIQRAGLDAVEITLDFSEFIKMPIAGLPADEARQLLMPDFQAQQYNGFDSGGTKQDIMISYVAHYPKALERVAQEILKVTKQSDQVLSVGEGQGHLAAYLQDQGLKNIRAIDISPKNTELARGKGVNQEVASAYQLPFKDEAFDVLVFNESIGGMIMEDAFKEAHRVLKKDGKIIITAYPAEEIPNRVEQARSTKYLYYSRLEINEAFGPAGFIVVDSNMIYTREVPEFDLEKYHFNVMLDVFVAMKPTSSKHVIKYPNGVQIGLPQFKILLETIKRKLMSGQVSFKSQVNIVKGRGFVEKRHLVVEGLENSKEIDAILAVLPKPDNYFSTSIEDGPIQAPLKGFLLSKVQFEIDRVSSIPDSAMKSGNGEGFFKDRRLALSVVFSGIVVAYHFPEISRYNTVRKQIDEEVPIINGLINDFVDDMNVKAFANDSDVGFNELWRYYLREKAKLEQIIKEKLPPVSAHAISVDGQRHEFKQRIEYIGMFLMYTELLRMQDEAKKFPSKKESMQERAKALLNTHGQFMSYKTKHQYKDFIDGNFIILPYLEINENPVVKDNLNIDKAQSINDVGGIDMNSANLDLLVKKDGKGVPLPVSQQDLAQFSRIQGLIPRILNIQPAASLSQFNVQ